METLKGTVSKVRILKMTDHPLVRFTLNEITCLIATHSLNFLADVEEGMDVVIAGYYNSRKQFIVKKYCVLGQTKIMMEFENIKMKSLAI